jgi:uncharacterized membrane protein required for colicin V production
MIKNGLLPINWFDIVVLIVLFLGYLRGKKHGMSQELMLVMSWIAVVLISAIAYRPLGQWADSMLHIGPLASFLLAYSFTAIVIALVFLYLKNTVGTKLLGSDTFGKAEFYLAMPAGMLRFACVLIALLALLNARQYRTAEINDMKKFQMDNYGSQFFPTLSSVQADVFENSFTGPKVREYIGFLLIEPTYPGAAVKNNAAYHQREYTLP